MKSCNIQTNGKYSNGKIHRIKNKMSAERITPQGFTHPCRKQCIKNRKINKKCQRNSKLRQKIITSYSYNGTYLHKIEHLCQDVIEECLTEQSILLAELIDDVIKLSEKKCKSILEFIESLNKSMQYGIDYFKQDHKTCETKMLKLLTKVNMQKFTINVNDTHNAYNMPQDEPKENILMAHCKTPIESRVSVKHRHFTIIIKKRHLFYNLSVCDIDTFSMCLFQKLAYFYIKSYLILNARQKGHLLPSNTMSTWYIRDLIQGLRFSIILKFNNASTLHYMRILFFVIITSFNLRLKIEITFECANGNKECVMLPPTPLKKIPDNIIYWYNKDRNKLMNSCSRIFHTVHLAPFFIRGGRDATRKAVSETILHNNSLSETTATHKNNFENFSEAAVNDNQLKFDMGLLDIKNTINYTNFAINASQRSMPSIVRNTDTCTNFALMMSQKTTSLSVQNTDIYTNFALNESQRIKPLSVGDIRFLHGERYIKKCNDCGEVGLYPRKQIYHIRYSALQQRTWMSQVYKINEKNEVLHSYITSVINESVFDQVEIPLEKYLIALTIYCAQCLVNALNYFCELKFDSKLFYKTFMSYLGYYLLP